MFLLWKGIKTIYKKKKSAEKQTFVPKSLSMQDLQVTTMNFWHKNILLISANSMHKDACLMVPLLQWKD